MKHLIWAIVIIAVAAGFFLEFRYEFNVHSPVVARFDRLTGDAWIVNAGVWRKVQAPPQEEAATALPAKAASTQTK